jgi:DNA-binding MarR family transcriptional regulator
MKKTQPLDPYLTEDGSVPHIGRSMARMRVMTGRRLIGRLAISSLAPDLELSHLDVLSVVARAEGVDEVTVGTIADRLRIDPSRASRVVTDMVGRNVLRRKESKEDARRIVVVLTPAGRRLVDEIQKLKLETVNRIVAGWPQEDLDAFAVLFDKFVTGFEDLFPREGD